MSNFVRPTRKSRPKHQQRRVYAEPKVLQGMGTEKPLPEEVWKSVKKAVGITERFIPPKETAK